MIKAIVKRYFESYNGIDPAVWWLSFAVFINRSGTMVLPFMSVYLTSEQMGFSLSHAGLVVSLYGVGSFLGAWQGGKISDRVGFMRVQISALLLGSLLFFALGQSTQYIVICVVTFALSFSNEMFRPANSAAVAFYSNDKNRTRSYSLNRIAGNLGWAIGISVGGFMADIGYVFLFVIDGATNFIAAITLIALVKSNRLSFAPIVKNNILSTNFAPPPLASIRSVAFIALVFVVVVGFFQMFSNVPVYLSSELHFSKSFVGLVLASNAATIVIFEVFLISAISDRFPNLLYIVVGTIMLGFSFLLFSVSFNGYAISFLVILCFSIGEMLTLPFMTSFWIAKAGNSNTGQYAGIYAMTWAAAQVIAPFGGALFAQFYGFKMLWILTSCILLLASLLFFMLYKSENRTELVHLNPN